MAAYARPTVMVVDDSEDIRELLRLQLAGLGYRVIAAGDGREAVEMAKKECPALILMDISMPVLDGLTATRMIREAAGISQIVIVAFTALHSGGNRQRALAAGCNDYVQKPVKLEQLSRLLNRHLQSRVF